jgi:hypothetical protein
LIDGVGVGAVCALIIVFPVHGNFLFGVHEEDVFGLRREKAKVSHH